ncbi:hypothetical protein AQPE_2432 [Aquipluma nitroreducens]|uniref:Uncharacterized protein n=1 Tax=Aquipluma nitroreducens TaxID=2010828 RepID=A0A5K7S9M6_9BACT|nr:hypothetical protein AQPE_2432 [Aquipluma nitroreducens]
MHKKTDQINKRLVYSFDQLYVSGFFPDYAFDLHLVLINQ